MFHFLSRLLGFAPPQVTHVHRRDRRVRLTLEVLEGRIVPASFDVWNLNDAGDGSLRAAIGGANGSGDTSNTIVFMRGAQPLTGTIALQSALPQISNNVQILGGPGGGPITVQGNATAQNPYSIFEVNTGVTAEIDNLTITGGAASFGGGGGILNYGSLTLNDDTITGNQALGNASGGGGIYNATGAGLYLIDTTICCNSSSSAGGGILNFGWIGDLYSTNDSVTGNTAAAQGGGIYNGLGSYFELSGLLIEYNQSQGFGGGVYNAGTFTMHQGEVLGNGANGNVSQGGGIFNSGRGTVTLDQNVTIEDNSANQGAGLYLGNGSQTTLNSVTIQNNNLTGNGPQGRGIYQQTGANLTMTSVTDSDDPNGLPVQGS